MGTYLRGLVAGLGRERSGEEILLFHSEPRDPVERRDPPALRGLFPAEGLRPVALRRPRRGVTLWDQVAWPLTLSRCRVDVFHSPFWTLPVLAGSRHALVQTIHDLTPLKIRGSVSMRNRVIFGVNFACARRARRIIVPSRATAEDVRSLLGISGDVVREVPEAATVEPSLLEGAARLLPEIRGRHGIPGRYVLHTGGHDPVKDLPTAIEAVAALAAAGREIRLVVTGEAGRGSEGLRARARASGLASGLILTGFVARADLIALYRGAAAVVYPSLNEGFGLPVLEAMTCGTPVVASRAGALPEVGGDACLYAQPGDAAGFASALGRILDDDALARSLGEAGRTRAAGFTWEEAARRTLAVYREAAA